MKKCTTVNNAELIINEATFAECIALQTELMNEAKKLDLDIGGIEIESLETASVSKILDSFKALFFGLMTSKDFDRAIFSCLRNCTYNGVQITKTLFDDMPEARKDYYQIIKECIEVNITPFLNSLTSQLSNLIQIPNTENQALDTQEHPID